MAWIPGSAMRVQTRTEKTTMMVWGMDWLSAPPWWSAIQHFSRRISRHHCSSCELRWKLSSRTRCFWGRRIGLVSRLQRVLEDHRVAGACQSFPSRD